MKLSLERDALQRGLAIVAGAVASKSTLPILGNLLLEAGPDGLRITATDLDMAVSLTVPTEPGMPGSVTLPSRRFVEIVKSLPAGMLRLSATEEGRVLIESGRSRFKLVGLPPADFPALPTVDFGSAWHVGAGAIQQLIEHVAFAASSEQSRPILNGVLWELRKDRMGMVATNGHRLARMDLPATGESRADLIIPPKALEQIRKAFPDDAEIEVARSENRIGFRSASTTVVARLIEGPYPNYQQVIPKNNDKEAIVDRLALLTALKRMAVVASDATHRIRLAFGGTDVRLSVQTPDVGEASERVAITYSGAPLEIGFNATYLIDILKHVPTDTVRITLMVPERPAIIEPVGWNDPATYSVLLMPLRLVA